METSQTINQKKGGDAATGEFFKAINLFVHFQGTLNRWVSFIRLRLETALYFGCASVGVKTPLPRGPEPLLFPSL